MRTLAGTVLFVVGTLLAARSLAAAESTPLPELIAKVASYQVTDDRNFINALRKTIRIADNEGRAAIEAALLDVLKDDEAALAARQLAADLLREVAGKPSLPVLAELLLNEKLSHTARSVLESIAGDEAISAMEMALPHAKGRIKIGIIDSLGRRGGAKAVPTLAALLPTQDLSVFQATVASLGGIDDPRILGILQKLDVAGERRAALDQALLDAAMGRLAAGQPELAAEVFRSLLAKGTASVHAGAQHGLRRATGQPEQ